MKASLEIRKATTGDWYSLFWCKDKNGEPIETIEDYQSMASQGVAILMGWADPVEL